MSLDNSNLVESTFLTEKQYAKFIQEVEYVPSLRAPISGAACKLLFEFMEDTGCRITEALHMEKKDINIKTGIVTVTNPKTETRCKCSKWEYADLRSRKMKLIEVNKNCKVCFGKGKWKKPQRTTITPRIKDKLEKFMERLKPNDKLWPVSRVSVWKWGKMAGINAGIDIFQQKNEKLIEGIFLHLFRSMCSIRMTRDLMNNPYKDDLITCKLRHSINNYAMKDRYTKVDINLLIAWERKFYSNQTKV